MTEPTFSTVIDAEPSLAMVYRHVYLVRQDLDAPALAQQLMPNYEMLLVFTFGAPFGEPMAFQVDGTTFTARQTVVLGPLQQILYYELPPGADLMVVLFTLNGFYRLMGKTLLASPTAPPRLLEPLPDHPALTTLWQELADVPPSDKQALERTQRFGAYALTHLRPPDALTQAMPDGVALFDQSTIDPVKALADAHQRTPRRIQQQMKTQLGYSGKELIRFVRFRKLLDRVIEQKASGIDWPGLVAEFGYHDQPHLIRDFRYFLGLSPRSFLKQLAQGGVCVSRPGRFY